MQQGAVGVVQRAVFHYVVVVRLKLDIFQVVATTECAVSNFANRCRNYNFYQTALICKSILCDCGYGISVQSIGDNQIVVVVQAYVIFQSGDDCFATLNGDIETNRVGVVGNAKSICTQLRGDRQFVQGNTDFFCLHVGFDL